MNICPICSPTVSISIPYTSNVCVMHSQPNYQGPGIGPETAIPTHLIQIKNKINKDMAEALPSIIKQVIKETREEVAKEIDEAMKNPKFFGTDEGHNIRLGLHFASRIARGKK